MEADLLAVLHRSQTPERRRGGGVVEAVSPTSAAAEADDDGEEGNRIMVEVVSSAGGEPRKFRYSLEDLARAVVGRAEDVMFATPDLDGLLLPVVGGMFWAIGVALTCVGVGAECSWSLAQVATALFGCFATVGTLHLWARALRNLRGQLLLATLFGAVTSSRRAAQEGLPHFRLHKVAHIRMWVLLRSLLRTHALRSAVAVMHVVRAVLLVSVLGIMSLYLSREDALPPTPSTAQIVAESPAYMLGIATAVLCTYVTFRAAALETATRQQSKHGAVLLTEQINLLLRIHRRPDKKDRLALANSVLGLTTKLIHDLEDQKGAPHLLGSLVRLVVLSALSAIISDAIGVKLRLWKLVKGF
jgi:hypothetical protein